MGHTFPPDARRPLTARRERFRYCGDPMFLTVAALYAVNRWLIKPHVPLNRTTFFAWHLNDLICIPFCLPPVLYIYRLVGLRRPDAFPTRWEIVSHLAVWSLTFEWIAPRYFHRQLPLAISDPWDIVAYAVGACAAGYRWGAWTPWRRTQRKEICP